MKTFYHVLLTALLISTKNSFVWFALTFWIYLETRSVVSTSFIGGLYLVATAGSGFWLGALVDRHKKKSVLQVTNVFTLCAFLVGLLLHQMAPVGSLESIHSVYVWALTIFLMTGVVAGNVVGIAVPTLVTQLVAEEQRDRANGLFGSVMGISFALTSVFSGVTLAYTGLTGVLVIATVLTFAAILYLAVIPIPEEKVDTHNEEDSAKGFHGKLDIAGTVRTIQLVPGLFALIFFTTLNNFLGGVFMALMDAYGLSLVSVQAWGFIWGFLSLGFILGGLIIAKRGLGRNPLSTLFRINLITWTVCIFFTIQPSIVLLVVGIFIWITLMPFIEATEQTIIQKVVPAQKQGRVFGFAHSVEQAASPITAFLIGPITQYLFIPFMTDGTGAQLVGSWFGVGTGRGIALVFSLTGLVGLLVTILAMKSKAYRLLSRRYLLDK